MEYEYFHCGYYTFCDKQMNTLIIHNATKRFKNRKVLTDVKLRCNTGEIVGIFGRNGSGKSTLLKILFGTLKADSLDAQINGTRYFPQRNIPSQYIAYLPQESFLPKDMKVRNVISIYFQDSQSQNKIFYDSRITKISNQWIKALSYGEMRYLETLLVSRLPHPFILLDEPFSMIEPLYQDAIKELLLSIKDEKGIILTDHYYHDVLQITNKNILVKDGKTIVIRNKTDLMKLGYIPEKQ